MPILTKLNGDAVSVVHNSDPDLILKGGPYVEAIHQSVF